MRSRKEECLDLDEKELVQAASTGNREAFAELYERYLGRVYRYLYYRVGNSHDAEDLTEQVFLKAWQAMPSYDYRGVPFSAWLYRLAHNLLIDARRAYRHTCQLDEALEIEADGMQPDELAQRREEVRELSSAVAQLSPVEQSVVVLRFIAGLDHRTVAGIIDKSEAATRSIQSRALARLASLLTPHERRKP
ncbi:MAG: RNA polymerase sigma factor [Chloroflexota bacterium]